MAKTNIKLTESNIPQEIMVRVVHLHEGNSTRKQRKGRKYATVCRLVGPTGDVISEGYAFCSNNDAPRRDIGRQVAIGRAMKEYYTEVADQLGV